MKSPVRDTCMHTVTRQSLSLLHTYTCACRWLPHSTQRNTDNRNQTPKYFTYIVYMHGVMKCLWRQGVLWCKMVEMCRLFLLHIFIFFCCAVDLQKYKNALNYIFSSAFKMWKKKFYFLNVLYMWSK